MKIVGSIVKIQGERVALVAVNKDVLAYSSEADRYVEQLGPVFDGLPVILFGQDAEGGKYYGESRLVEKLSEVDPAKVPWQEIDVDL